MVKIKLLSLCLAASLLLVACSGLVIQKETPALTASGTIAADSTKVSAEISGKLVHIKVNQGDTVKAGDVLFTLDDQVLQAQHDQATAAVAVAQAAVDVAQAAVDAAQSKQTNAQAQYDLAEQAARAQDRQNRSTTWTVTQPSQFKQPVWYFQKSEQIAALKTEVDAATKALSDEQSNLQDTLKKASNEDFVAAETRLAAAQAAFQVETQTLDQAKAAQNNSNLVDAAQKLMDAAQSELDAAQQAYNKMLSTSTATDVLEARARLSAAQARLDNANDAYDQLQTGDNSMQVQVAQTGIDEAKTAVAQAQAALTQAKAALRQAQSAVKLLEVQIAKTTVSAPVGGVVLSRPQNPGEITAAGATVVEVGTLDTVKLTVYVPEDQYGQIELGQQVKVAVDSFAGRTFTGAVTQISDQAEFTPRNVQTVESRSTTVYAIEITISNPDHSLKDGMPADATF